MINVIKTSGIPFSGDISSCHGFKPSKFEWLHHSESDSSDIIVYGDFDHMGGFKSYQGFRNNREILKFLVSGFRTKRDKLKFLMGGFKKYGKLGNDKDRLKFLWLSESREITGKGAYDHVLKNADLFLDCYDAIFVHDREMIEKDNRFTYVPNASNKYWIVDCGIHQKTKIVHFTTGVKPWHYECRVPYAEEYYKYLAMTPWGNYRPTRSLVDIVNKGVRMFRRRLTGAMLGYRV